MSRLTEQPFDEREEVRCRLQFYITARAKMFRPPQSAAEAFEAFEPVAQ